MLCSGINGLLGWLLALVCCRVDEECGDHPAGNAVEGLVVQLYFESAELVTPRLCKSSSSAVWTLPGEKLPGTDKYHNRLHHLQMRHLGSCVLPMAGGKTEALEEAELCPVSWTPAVGGEE